MTAVRAVADDAVRANDKSNKQAIFTNVHHLPTTQLK